MDVWTPTPSHPWDLSPALPPACCPMAQPLKVSLIFIPAKICSRDPQLLPAWELLYPDTLPHAWIRHASQWGCISKVPITRLSGKGALQTYTKLNKTRAVLCP